LSYIKISDFKTNKQLNIIHRHQTKSSKSQAVRTSERRVGVSKRVGTDLMCAALLQQLLVSVMMIPALFGATIGRHHVHLPMVL